MTKIDGTSMVKRSSSVLTVEIEGEAVMLDAVRGQYYGLDVIGTEIWARLIEPTKVSDLLAYLNREFDSEPETIERDVLDLLSVMAENEMVTVET